MLPTSPMPRILLLCGLLGASSPGCTRHAMVSLGRDAGGTFSEVGNQVDADEARDAAEDLPADSGAPEAESVADRPTDPGSAERGADGAGETGVEVSRDVAADLRNSDGGSERPVDLGAPDGGSVVLTAVLPSPRHEPAVFSDGQAVYVAGGLDDKGTILAEIVRFVPVTGAVERLPDVLPGPVYAAGVAWTGTAAYLFGGLDRSGARRQIVRYEPGTGLATVMSAQLPVAAYNVGAVWTGKAIHAFGGVVGPNHLTQILSYDPATDTLSTLTATLALGIEAAGVFWDGSLVWVLGGKADASGSSGVASNVVQTFDPGSGQVALRGTLPYATWDAPSFSDGTVFYLAGGSQTSTTGYTSIVRFDPVGAAASTLSQSLPLRVAGKVGTWVASVGAGYICGGADYTSGKPSDKIVQVVP